MCPSLRKFISLFSLIITDYVNFASPSLLECADSTVSRKILCVVLLTVRSLAAGFIHQASAWLETTILRLNC